jgi:hypothetical protein
MTALIVVYAHAHADDIHDVVQGAIKQQIVETDHDSVRAVKSALAEAESTLLALAQLADVGVQRAEPRPSDEVARRSTPPNSPAAWRGTGRPRVARRAGPFSA